MSEWKEYKLGEIAEIKGGKRLPKGELLVDYETPHPYIRVTDMGKKWIRKSGLQFVTPKVQKTISRYVVNSGDVILSIVGSIGLVGRISQELNGANLTENCVKLLTNKTIVNDDFLFYFLISDEGQYEIEKRNVGSTQPKLPLYNIKDIDIFLPPLPEQKAIASILSCLDDKIDLLHRQNATLEKMAETLFRQWFIEEAKEREKTKIGLVLETVLGGTPSTKKPEYWDGTIPWINSGEVNNFRILKPTKFITELGLAESNTKLLPIGTTVLAITGATLGQISLLEISTCANQSVVGIIPNETYPKEYVFLWIKYMIDEIILNETGGAQPHINKNDVNETEILVPCNDDLEFIESKIKPLFKKISINSFQINTLIELRDSLLPKLMSGEITVNQG